MQQQRSRFKLNASKLDAPKLNVPLEKRLAEEARRLREQAKLLRPGAPRDELLRKARQAETGSHMSEWLNSPGLQPPRWPG